MKAMKLFFTLLLTLFTMNISAQVETPKDTPQLEFALQLKVTLGGTFGIDNTQHGRRTVIPITGGTFEPSSAVAPTISWPMLTDAQR